MRQALENRGKIMSEWRIRRIMRENGLYPEQLRKFKPGGRGKSEGRYCENVVQQQFSPEKPNEIWAGDITYLRTKLGWVYLAVVIDLYNREEIGYAVSKRIDAELVCQARAMRLRGSEGRKRWCSTATGDVSTAASDISKCFRTTGSEAA